MCGLIWGIKTGVPNPFPGDPMAKTGFYTQDQEVEKDYGTYTRVRGTRQTALISAYGSPSQKRQLRDVEEVPVKLFHTVQSIDLKSSDFRGLINWDTKGSDIRIDPKGVQKIAFQISQFNDQIENLRISMLISLLFQGNVWFNGQGQVLTSSSGSRFSASTQQPSYCQGQLPCVGGVPNTNTNIIDTTWSNTSSDIVQQIIALKQAAVRLTGYRLKYAFYGKNIPNYFLTNATIASFFIRDPVANREFMQTGDIPDPFVGLTWLPAYDAGFFEDASGNLQTGLVGDDQVVFTPEPSGEWLGWLAGGYDIPGVKSTVDSNAMAMLADMDVVYGKFAYSTLQLDPPSIKLVAGDTFLPVVKVPTAYFTATVKF